MVTPEFKGAFEHCSWCGGRGCNQCTYERQKWFEANFEPDGTPKPLFTANPNDPQDMDLLKMVVGRETLEKAFGPDGGGIDEIRRNAAAANVIQALRGRRKDPPDAAPERQGEV